jgi:hypothetical protein
MRSTHCLIVHCLRAVFLSKLAVFSAVAFCIAIPAPASGALTLLTTRAEVNANLTIDWQVLGGANTDVATNPFSINSDTGQGFTVSKPTAGAFNRRNQVPPAGGGWTGNFAPGDALLTHLNSDGPVVIAVSAAQAVFSAAGLQIQPNQSGAFVATIEAFDVNGASLGSFSVNGTSNGNSDNSAIFIGVRSDTQNIHSISVDTNSTENGGDFAINKVSLKATVPPDPAPTPAPTVTDFWDVNRGATVLNTSGAGLGDIRNMFGGDFASYPGEAGNTLLQDGKAAGFVHSVEWKSAQPTQVSGYRLFVGQDGPTNGSRGISEFRLYALNTASNTFQLIDTIAIANPYSSMRVSFTRAVTPLTAQTFRGEFVQFAPAPYGGPRIVELDAISTEVAPPVHWLGGNGLWHDAAKWSGGAVPNSPSADVAVDNAPGTNSIITIGIGTTGSVGRLRIDAGDRVQTQDNSALYVTATAFPGAGELLLNGTLAIPGQELVGDKVINGTGKLVLGGVAGQNARVTGATTNNGTIEGSGQFGFYNSNRYRTDNNGTINANVPGQGLLLYGLTGASRSTNSGTLKASNGGSLLLGQGQWFGSPTSSIIADGPGSELLFKDSVLVEGGSLSAINGGLIRPGGDGSFHTNGVWKDLTVSGPTEVRKGALYLTGTIMNNGVITVPNDSGLLDIAPASGQTVTLAGTGQIVLDKPSTYANQTVAFLDQNGQNSKLVIQDQLVRGRGFVGYESYPYPSGVEITNRGTFQADRNGELLRLFIGVIDNQNGGTLRAQDGGILRLHISGTLKNTGGTIEALSGGTVDATFARIEGGLIRNIGGFIPLGGMTLFNPGTGMRLEGDLTLGLPAGNQEATMINGIENVGVLRVTGLGPWAALRIGENGAPGVTLTGGGELRLGDAANGSNESYLTEYYHHLGGQVTTLTSTDNTISGFGTFGDASANRLIFNNTSVVKADVSGKSLHLGLRTIDNTGGIFRATSGGNLRLRANNGFDNVGGLIEAQANSSVAFNWFTEVSGGLLRNTGGTFDLSHAIIKNPGSGVTLQGPFVINNSREARFVGEIRNEGSVTALHEFNDTRLMIGAAGAPNVVMTGGGELVVNGTVANQEYGRILEGVDGATLTLEDQTLRGSGLIGYTHGNYRQLRIVNNRSIDADENGKILQLSILHLQNNAGSIARATNGGNLLFDSNTIANAGASIVAGIGSTVTFGADGNYRRISGGVVQAGSGGTLNLQEGIRAEGGVAFNNAGTAIFGNLSAERSFNGSENGGGTFHNAGTIRKIGNTTYWLNAPFTHTGAVNTEAGVLRLVRGGTVTNGSFTTAPNAWTGPTNSAAPYTFSGSGNVINGAGRFFLDNSSLILTDAATNIAATNFGFYGGSSITGPGTMSISGELAFTNYSDSTISGAKLINLAGASGVIDITGAPRAVRFTNGASFENRGTLTSQGYGNAIEGAAGTLFTNVAGGTLIGNTHTAIVMPFVNSGAVQVNGGQFSLHRSTTFANGTAALANTTKLLLTDGATLTVDGEENAISGLGVAELNAGTLSFNAGAKLAAGKLSVVSGSGITGQGILDVTAQLKFFGYLFDSTITQTRLRLAEGGTGEIDDHAGTIRLNDGAVLENNGTLNIRRGPTFTGAAPALFQTNETGTTNFSDGTALNVPVEINTGKWTLNAGAARTVTLDRGASFTDALFTSTQVTSQWRFTGTAPFKFSGMANQSVSGIMNFDDAHLQFEDSTPSDPVDDPRLYTSSQILFTGAAASGSIISGRGEFSTTAGFVFSSGNVFVQDATLINDAINGAQSLFNSPNGKLSLSSGARFINRAPLLIQAAGSMFTGLTGTLFHNAPGGRVIQDTNTTTTFDVPFLNEGFLEFRKGIINFLQPFSGNGGIAVSGGSKVDLGQTAFTDPNNLPSGLQASGAGSELKITLASGQVHQVNNPDSVKAVAGGKVDHRGGSALEFSGPSATGVAQGLGSVIAKSGGDMIGLDGASIITHDGASIITHDGASIITHDGASMIGLDGGSMIGQDGGSLIGQDGGSLVAGPASSLVATGGGPMVAAGGLNRAGSLNQRGTMKARLPRGGRDAATGISGLDAIMAKVDSLSTDPSAGRIFVDTGGNASVAGGSIIAEDGGIIAGGGTFTGPGLIKSGGALLPGSTVGTLTWNGNLTIQSGGLLQAEIGGAAAGTYDRVNITGTLTLNGAVGVRFVNSFGNVQPTDVFDIVTATSPIVTALAGTRAAVIGTNGSFGIQLVNDGKTLRLTDYQTTGPVTFNSWANSYGLTGANAAWDADPNNNGNSNLLDYALGLDPTVGGSTGIKSGIVEENGQKFQTLSYSRPTGADARMDITYTPERATSLVLANWSSSVVDIIPHGVTPGPGSLETVTVRSTHPMSSTNREFLRLKVTLNQ